MSFLSEDPTYPMAVLVFAAGAFLVALKVTQQAKYLFWALGMLGVAGVVLIVEYVWVTDAEKIEEVVYDLKNDVLAADVEGVLAHLTPNVEYGQGGAYLSGEETRELIRINLSNAHFEFIHITNLSINAGSQTGRGTAEFQVYAKGTLRMPTAVLTVGTANSTWSLGFEKDSQGVWQVNRITPVSIPQGTINVPARSFSTGSKGRAR